MLVSSQASVECDHTIYNLLGVMKMFPCAFMCHMLRVLLSCVACLAFHELHLHHMPHLCFVFVLCVHVSQFMSSRCTFLKCVMPSCRSVRVFMSSCSHALLMRSFVSCHAGSCAHVLMSCRFCASYFNFQFCMFCVWGFHSCLPARLFCLVKCNLHTSYSEGP